MNKSYLLFLISAILFFPNCSNAQKVINTAILEYDVTTLDSSDSTFNTKSHQKYFYAPNMLRTDSWYDDGSSETYYNGVKKTITTLESGGGESLYSNYSLEQWKEKSPTYIRKFEPLSEEKSIQEWKCKAAKIYFKDNTSEKIFYTTEFAPETEKKPITKLGVPGFILERQVFNIKNELIQKVTLKSFKQTASPLKTFIPNSKDYTKKDIYE